MKLDLRRLGTLTWAAIYGGLLVASLGFAAARNGADLGWVLVGGGAAAACAGIVMIWIRSRVREPGGP